jgi:ankyrin repeat protein
MTRIENQAEKSVQLSKKVLSYLYCAKRPLTWKELCHALALESGDVELDNTALHYEETVLNSSAGLIRIDEQSKITTLVHYTLQEYLTQYPEKLLPEPEVELAKACLIYLSFDTFQSGPCGDGNSLEQRLEMYHFLDYAANNWGHHMRNDQEMDLLTNFLRDEQKISSSVQVLYIPHFRMKGWQGRFPKSFSPIHVCAFWGLDKMLATLCKDGRDLDYQDSHGTTALHLASQHGHLATARFLVEKNATIDIINNRGETALSLAARNGYTTAVEFLLANGADAMVNDYNQWSALEWAVIGGFNNVIEVLLKHIVKNDMEGDHLSKSLRLAAEVGSNEAVQLLLESGADIECKDYLGNTALACAVSEGHEGTVRVLLENGANANMVDDADCRPLHSAIQHESIARLLLENGAEVNAISYRQQNALLWCALDGSEEVLKILLQRGADIHAQDKYGVTALHATALKGREAMAHLLLENHADPNKQDNDHWTPLHAAIFAGHDGLVRLLLPKVEDGLQIVADMTSRMKDARIRAKTSELVDIKSQGNTVVTGFHGAIFQVPRLLALLEAGADIDAEDISGHTALTLASGIGLEDCVRLLLENGADVNKADRSGRMPLHWAVAWGSENIVKMLIEYGADINADIQFWTPLLLAANEEFMPMVEYLAEKGADINAKNYNLMTALHYVSKTGSAKIAQLLIDKGAHVNIVDRWEKSPLEYAIESKNDEVKEVLQRSGANDKINGQRHMTKYSRQ